MIKRLGRYKTYAERSKQYVGTLTLFIQISLFTAINIGLELSWWQYIVLFVICIPLVIIVGYFDRKSGLLSAEQESFGRVNPIYDDIFERLDRIEKKL